jgi:hypothetical protein
MFETVADQADGLRRLFVPREPALIPAGCCAPANGCRRHAASIAARLARHGFTPRLFDRLDLDEDLGDVEAHAPVDRLLLLEHPVRLARWLASRSTGGDAAMLLLLSHRPDALPTQYATVKAIAATRGVRRFLTCFVDAPGTAAGRQAHLRLAACVGRFLDVEIAPLAPDAHDDPLGDAAMVRLARLEVGIRGVASGGLLLDVPLAMPPRSH